jgi:endonuclease YncB( thermonuclease family)
MKPRSKFPVLQLFVCGALVAAVIGFLSLLPPTPARTVGHSNQSQESYEGLVIKVTDGDSITVRASDANIKIRLAEIDAPERGQAWGHNARDELQGLVAGKTVTVHPKGQDRYGRVIAQIEADGQDVNREMVLRGSAWAYRAYLHDPTMIEFETRARTAQAGLWSMPESQRVAPWDYRQEKRGREAVAAAR